MSQDCFEGHLQGRQSILQRRSIDMVECEYSEIGGTRLPDGDYGVFAKKAWRRRLLHQNQRRRGILQAPNSHDRVHVVRV